jgi:hypothetical protein
VRALLFAGSLVFVLQSAALACQCGRFPSVQEAASEAQMVVRAVVVAGRPGVVPRDRLRFSEFVIRDMPTLSPVTRFDLAVVQGFKGDPRRTLTLTHFGCCICEESLEVGREYVLFIRPHHSLADAYMASSCDPNQVASDSAAAHAVLGPPRFINAPQRSKRSIRQRAGDAVQKVLHWSVVRAMSYGERTGRNPLRMVRESPWSGFALYVGGGAALGALVVLVRRRFRRPA